MPSNLEQSMSAAPKRRRRELTPEGRENLRQSCLRRKPWLKSTGPKTTSGKARSAANSLQHGLYSSDPAVRVVGKFLLGEEDYERALETLRPVFERRLQAQELDAQ